MKKLFLVTLATLMVAGLILSGCTQPAPTPTPTPSPTVSPTPSASLTPTPSQTPTQSVAPSPTPTQQEWVPPIPGMKKGEEDMYFEYTFASTSPRPAMPSPYTIVDKESLFTALEEATGGRFKVKYGYGGILGSAKEMPAMIGAGAIDMGMFPVTFVTSQLPYATMAQALGWYPLDQEKTDLLAENIYFDPMVQACYANMNMICVSVWTTDPSLLIVRKGLGKKIETAEDLKGLQMGGSSSINIWSKELGMVPVTLDTSGYYEAMQKGMIDCAKMAFTSFHPTYRLEEVTGAIINYPLGIGAIPVAMNKDKWDALPQYIKDLWWKLYPTANSEYGRKIKAAFVEQGLAICKEQGIEVYDLAPEEVAKLDAANIPVWDAWYEQMQGFPSAQQISDFVKGQIAYRDKLTGVPWTLFTPPD